MSTITHEPVTQPVTTIDVPAVGDEEGRRREVLLRAAEVIETQGWTSGSKGMNVGGGPVCLLGAVAVAANCGRWWSDDMFIKAGQKLGRYHMFEPAEILGVNLEAAYGWNDRLQYRKLPRKGLFKRMSGGEAVASALRRMANGAHWEDATQL